MRSIATNMNREAASVHSAAANSRAQRLVPSTRKPGLPALQILPPYTVCVHELCRGAVATECRSKRFFWTRPHSVDFRRGCSMPGMGSYSALRPVNQDLQLVCQGEPLWRHARQPLLGANSVSSSIVSRAARISGLSPTARLWRRVVPLPVRGGPVTIFITML